MKIKLITLLSKFTWILAVFIPAILGLRGNSPLKCFLFAITILLLGCTEYIFSKYHEKLHILVAKHYHPECEYKITEKHFSCSDPKAFNSREIRIVAASANALNFVIAIPFATIAAVSLETKLAISILIVSLYNFVIASDKDTTDGYIIVFPEKFYEVGRF